MATAKASDKKRYPRMRKDTLRDFLYLLVITVLSLIFLGERVYIFSPYRAMQYPSFIYLRFCRSSYRR